MYPLRFEPSKSSTRTGPLRVWRPAVHPILMSTHLKLAGLGLAVCCASAAVTWFVLKKPVADFYKARPHGSITFNKDIAPIVRERCVGCHRPGQSGPFNLITFEDVHKRAKQIAEVTGTRYMPPWLPEKGYGDFANERRLTATELGLLQQWIAEGAVEGAGSNGALPPVPADDWQLGKPDLVITMPTPYTLPASGKDVYRNFIVPVPSETKRFVRAFEFRPGNKVVHHAFMYTDRTRQARRLQQGQDGLAGFDGMDTPPSADGPNGFFASWQPGKIASKGMDGLAWELGNQSDILFQLHMKPSGKPELVQPSLALYFTDEPPTNTPFKLCLTSYQIDIPAGSTNYLIEDSYTLPVGAELLGILPHAHYLGKEMRGFATLPDGTRKWLLWIRNWDFNWQGDYRYKQPIFLPKGSKLTMQFAYDNSTNNIRNPNSPPQRVRYGVQSTDEMGELWLQLLPANGRELNTLATDYSSHILRDRIDYNNYRLRLNPNDARGHSGLGTAYLMQNRLPEAYQELQTAVQLDPKLDEAHYYLGILLRQFGKPVEARAQFEAAIQISPEHQRAHGNLGLVLMELNDLKGAEEEFRTALRMNGDDSIAHDSLGVIMMQDGRLREAEEHLRQAARIAPQDRRVAEHLQSLARLNRSN